MEQLLLTIRHFAMITKFPTKKKLSLNVFFPGESPPHGREIHFWENQEELAGEEAATTLPLTKLLYNPILASTVLSILIHCPVLSPRYNIRF
jgi:hypothetical protein